MARVLRICGGLCQPFRKSAIAVAIASTWVASPPVVFCGFVCQGFAMSDDFPGKPRGTYLIQGGAVISLDPTIGTLPRADVLIRDVIAQIGPVSMPTAPKSSMRHG